MNPDLQTRFDEREIINVCVRYAAALDARDWVALRTCFVPDAVATYEGVGDCVGYEAIEQLCRTALAPLTRSSTSWETSW